MNIVLAGQPNCGKSTIFNHVVGYKSYTANFPGASVNYTHGETTIESKKIKIIDLPGIYSLTHGDKAEEVSKKYILNNKIDHIINIMDASVMARSLELTLELMEFKLPMVINLNMIDEAEKKGMTIDTARLSKLMGSPVVTSIGAKGSGVKKIFRTAVKSSKNNIAGVIKFDADIENSISKIENIISSCNLNLSLNSRLVALRLIEDDKWFWDLVNILSAANIKKIKEIISKIEKIHDLSGVELINQARHAKAMWIFEQVVTFHKIKKDFREQIDNVLMHPVWGYIFLLGTLFLMFYTIFSFGNLLEGLFLENYEKLQHLIGKHLPEQTFLYSLVDGALQGIGGGIAIVLPYLVPFLLLLSLLEDIGYLPRIAYLMDILMHKIGLHGTSIIPAILGYGCNVPAVMATRILNSSRDRFIAATISAMVPCSARMTIIFGLAAFYLGPAAAFIIYLLNILVIGILGHIMSRIMPEVSPGMLMEIPPYHLPSSKTILLKTWLRLKEFIIIAWPVLIAGSIVLNFIQYYELDVVFNRILYPITASLGLPFEVGNTLIFGVLRKELSLIMLLQALGTTDAASVLSYTQILTF
ncbi:MAG: ferrous iron transport protein B, partial [Calditrichia bacterium]|nr:ferrous iron transport protein B [Calditrichia bacterium]